MGRDIIDWPAADYFIRPERREHRKTILDRLAWELAGFVARPVRIHLSGLNRIAGKVERYKHLLEGKDDGNLKEIAGLLRRRLRLQGFNEDVVAETFALIRETARRTLGMSHFDCQIVGGYALLKGLLAEMETGEGKTLVATLPAATAALAGLPVHIITVNDYLTLRDAEWMGDIYRFLGLSVGCIIHEKTPVERRDAYQCDVTYCTNKEIVFDYLRDRIILGDSTDPLRLYAEHLYNEEGKCNKLLLRGLHYAIVDEADSVLIDEARTPLIISETEDSGDEKDTMQQALAVADSLRDGTDYQIEYESDAGLRTIVITHTGRDKIQKVTEPLGIVWRSSVRREELVRKGLTALRLFRRDEHYLVRDGKIQIIDEFTGRVMPDRSWEGGLHQLIEVKEGCEISGQKETVARISYQRFFRRYLKISGMTGTANEVTKELWSIYGLPVVRMPTNRPLQRISEPDRIFATADEKWQAVVQRIRELHDNGRPVLIGTRTVAASEHLSSLLMEAGLSHQVLNARQDEEEALIIARAGEYGRITIATNMAGRGTDIKLASGITEIGGLHVIMTERHEASRIDRQLAGRCGRQGDPGSYEAFLSLEDPLLREGSQGLLGRASELLRGNGYDVWKVVGRCSIIRAQKKVEKAHTGVRKRLLRYDEERGDTLSFSGRSE